MDEEDMQLIYEDFCKIYIIVNRLSARYPEIHKSWTGTISERLAFLVTKLIEEIDSIKQG